MASKLIKTWKFRKMHSTVYTSGCRISTVRLTHTLNSL